jgi:hypothetical protein
VEFKKTLHQVRAPFPDHVTTHRICATDRRCRVAAPSRHRTFHSQVPDKTGQMRVRFGVPGSAPLCDSHLPPVIGHVNCITGLEGHCARWIAQERLSHPYICLLHRPVHPAVIARRRHVMRIDQQLSQVDGHVQHWNKSCRRLPHTPGVLVCRSEVCRLLL